MKNKVALIIRDGWGFRRQTDYNAIVQADTPNMDAYLSKYPYTMLVAAGEKVGLPAGYQGSSEVGHLNMGAGRIVIQELRRINDALADGSFYEKAAFKRVIANCKRNNSALHLMGLVQDEGVHAHQDHLFAIMRQAKQVGIKKLYIHFFADGRDTPPRSALGFLRTLNDKIPEYGLGEIATLMGRYYAMDRAQNWDLTSQAYRAITCAEGIRVKSAKEAIQRAYTDDKTPDHTQMVDEYIPPSIIGDYAGAADGDSVIHFNYRQDRAIQLTYAFIEDDYPAGRDKKFKLTYAGLTKYYDAFKDNILDALDSGSGMDNILGEVLSRHGVRQLRISETQKFKHVTSFFNGKLIKPFALEDRIEIKGTYDPAMFAVHPEMNAYDICKRVLPIIENGKYDLIVINFANCDMVGHTGDFEATKKAVSVVDECVGRVVSKNMACGYVSLVTADHGNAEEMFDYKVGLPKTSHTVNPVEFIYVADDYKNVSLRRDGILSDISPTILGVLGIKKPDDMTCSSLINLNA